MTYVDPKKVSRLKFRFSFAVGGKVQVSPEIRRLGKKAQEFFIALTQLSSAGNRQAEHSLRLTVCSAFQEEQGRHEAKLSGEGHPSI